MPGRKANKRKKRPKTVIQRATGSDRSASKDNIRERSRQFDHRLLYSVSDDACIRPASGGQEHSRPKITDDGVQKYEKTLVSRQAINTLISQG